MNKYILLTLVLIGSANSTQFPNEIEKPFAEINIGREPKTPTDWAKVVKDSTAYGVTYGIVSMMDATVQKGLAEYKTNTGTISFRWKTELVKGGAR